VNPAASSRRPRKRDKRESSLVDLDEDHGSYVELGTIARNPPV
jgi:hypothetical protein